jgi:hypothetical protein
LERSAARAFEVGEPILPSHWPAHRFRTPQPQRPFLIFTRFQQGRNIRDTIPHRILAGDTIVAKSYERPRARPRPVHRPLAQARADRIHRDVPDRRHQMIFVHRNATESALPEMPGPTLPGVHMAGVSTMQRGERSPQPVVVRRHQDQVNMVGHKNERPDFDVRGPAMGGKKRAIQFVIAVVEECLLSAIAALGNMVRSAGKNRSRKTRHCHALN